MTFFYLLCTDRYDAFSRLQAGCDHPERVHSRPDLHGAELRPVIGADDCDLAGALLLTHRGLGHEQCSLNLSGWRLNACVLAGSQQVFGIGELANDLNSSSLYVYLAIREDDSAGMWVGTSVG